MSTLALIQAALAAQGPASTAAAAIQAALTADAALFADLSANGPAVIVDTTQTPPAVVLYAASENVANPYLAAAIEGGQQVIIESGMNSYTATPVRTAT